MNSLQLGFILQNHMNKDSQDSCQSKHKNSKRDLGGLLKIYTVH